MIVFCNVETNYMKTLILFIGLLASMQLMAQSNSKVTMYPNPANGFVKINFSETPKTDITFTISDILGNKIETITYKASDIITCDFSSLNLINGMYLIKIEYGDQVVLKKLLVKNS
jgi:hypothetical protein